MTLRFSLREHKSYAAFDPVIGFSKPSGSEVRCASTITSIGDGYIFISIDREWLNGKYIRFRWSGYFWGGATTAYVRIYDGLYDRSSGVDFPNGSGLLIKGNGLLQTLRTKTSTFSAETINSLINVSGGNQAYCTVFFQVHDPMSSGTLYFDLDWFEINAQTGGAENIYSETFDDSVHMEVTGTLNDYGYISDGNPIPSGPAYADLKAIFIARHTATRQVRAKFWLGHCYDLSDSQGISFMWWGSGSVEMIDFEMNSPTGSWIGKFPDGPAEWTWIFFSWDDLTPTDINGTLPTKTICGIYWTYHSPGVRRVDWITAYSCADLKAKFDVKHPASVDLKAIVWPAQWVVLKGIFTPRRDASEDLVGGFSVRQSTSREFPMEFAVRFSASSDLLAEFSAGYPAAEDLKGVFEVIPE